MRLKIAVKPTDDGWEVQVFDLKTNTPAIDPVSEDALLKTPRKLSRVGDSLQGFPQPPNDEAAAIPAAEPHYDLCTTKDVAVVKTTYSALMNRDIKDNRPVRFGRYLFDTLLGEELWQKIDKLSEKEPLELALSFKDDDYAIGRLPWEMMRSPDRFLAEEPQVAVTRLVAGTTQKLEEITPPRVLFVVGSDLATDVIRPGAEFLGLLRNLPRSKGLRMKTHLLLRATPKTLAAAIKWFEPTVVHFICHGLRTSTQVPYLQLQSDENADNGKAFAENLIQLLQSSGKPPQIVVLSACYSATVNDEKQNVTGGDVESPLAMALVKGKVPVTVGMAGKVADQACRLFTQRFYESLLEGADLAQAAAEGRRAGVIANGGTDPKSSVDWALPTMFLSEGVEQARLKIQDQELEQDWHGIATQYATPGYPPFCDRLELFQLYDLLMADDPLESRRKREGDLQVLAISVSQADIAAGVEGHRYGCSWVLKELAAQAVLDGHVPVLVNDDVVYGKGCPSTLQELIPVIITAGLTTKQRFNQVIEERSGQTAGFGTVSKLKWTAAQLKLLNGIEGGASADGLHEDVKEIFDLARSASDPGVVARALRTDLLCLLDEIKTLRPEKERQKTKLLLLVDNIHRMDAAADALLNHLMGPLGMRGKRKQIRVILTYSTVPAATQEQAVNNYIKKWLENANHAEPVALQRFKPPVEDLMAYEQYLLRWEDKKVRQPLAVKLQADQKFVTSFFKLLSSEVEGIPSNLRMAASPIVRTFIELGILREANDEDQLRTIRQQPRQ